jgi:hypothetical protein
MEKNDVNHIKSIVISEQKLELSGKIADGPTYNAE